MVCERGEFTHSILWRFCRNNSIKFSCRKNILFFQRNIDGFCTQCSKGSVHLLIRFNFLFCVQNDVKMLLFIRETLHRNKFSQWVGLILLSKSQRWRLIWQISWGYLHSFAYFSRIFIPSDCVKPFFHTLHHCDFCVNKSRSFFSFWV